MSFALIIPRVAMTDSDAKERLALRKVWPEIKLRLCLYHFIKAAVNHMTKTLGSGGDAAQKAARHKMKQFIRQFLEKYAVSAHAV